MTEDERGFPWLILIGVFLVAALAVISFLPNSLVHPISPTTKVTGELRSIAIAIYDFESAKKVVSTPLQFSDEFVFGSVDNVFPDLVTVIDPLEIGDLFKDEYHPSDDLYRAAAWNDTFVLISVGPDEILNVTVDQIKEGIKQGEIAKLARVRWAYSPTNGLDSRGDIFRVQTELAPRGVEVQLPPNRSPD